MVVEKDIGKQPSWYSSRSLCHVNHHPHFNRMASSPWKASSNNTRATTMTEKWEEALIMSRLLNGGKVFQAESIKKVSNSTISHATLLRSKLWVFLRRSFFTPPPPPQHNRKHGLCLPFFLRRLKVQGTTTSVVVAFWSDTLNENFWLTTNKCYGSRCLNSAKMFKRRSGDVPLMDRRRERTNPRLSVIDSVTSRTLVAGMNVQVVTNIE